MFETASGILLIATGWNGSAGNRARPPSWSGVGGISGRRQSSPARAWVGWCARPGRPVTLAALLTLDLAAMGAVGAAGDRPGAGAGLSGVALGVQLHHHPGAQGRVVLGPPHPLGQLPTGPGPDGKLAAVGRPTSTGSRLGVAGRPVRWRAALIARCRTASGLLAGMPRPCRRKALRRDGQGVPNSAAAVITEPSRSARAKYARPRPGRPGSGWAASPPAAPAPAGPTARRRPSGPRGGCPGTAGLKDSSLQ
jgi:hypothetical protein